MNLIKTLLISVVLTGCGTGNLLLIDSNNIQSNGSFNSWSKSLEVTINNKKYSGFYITNSSYAISTGQFYGNSTMYGNAQTYIGGNSGSAVLRSDDGDTIQCNFNYQGMKGIGSCVDSKGAKYQLIAG